MPTMSLSFSHHNTISLHHPYALPTMPLPLLPPLAHLMLPLVWIMPSPNYLALHPPPQLSPLSLNQRQYSSPAPLLPAQSPKVLLPNAPEPPTLLTRNALSTLPLSTLPLPFAAHSDALLPPLLPPTTPLPMTIQWMNLRILFPFLTLTQLSNMIYTQHLILLPRLLIPTMTMTTMTTMTMMTTTMTTTTTTMKRLWILLAPPNQSQDQPIVPFHKTLLTTAPTLLPPLNLKSYFRPSQSPSYKPFTTAHAFTFLLLLSVIT